MSSVYVWLSLAELRAADACPDGMREAEAMARGQGRADKIRLRWDPLGSAWFWAVYPGHASWLARRGLIPPSASATAGDAGTATAGDGGTATAGDYGTATAGVRGTATATAGAYGTATAGAYGTATAGAYGTATAGDDGMATAGDDGMATAGARGMATAGARGTATAGARGEIRIRFWCSQTDRYRTAIGYVGEDGILPGVAYVVRDGKLVRKDGAS